MASFLADRSSKVLVVEASGSIRQMMTDVVRSGLGFENVEGMASVTDALQYLEIEKVKWIILSLSADQPTNALHILRICTEHPERRDVRVSLFINEDETFVLPTAFTLGLLSYHLKPVTKETFEDDLKKLMALLERDSFNETLTAARYLRDMLKLKQQHQQQLDLEKNLLAIYPGNPQLLFNMVEPQFRLGQQETARSLLYQVRLIDPSFTDEVEKLAVSLLGGPLRTRQEDTTHENVLGLEICLVIDSDESVRRNIIEILSSLGVKDVQGFADGEAAWSHMNDKPEPDLIVMEWRIPKVSGPALVQRMRNHGFLTVPVIVISSLIKQEDLPLIKEMGVADLIQKPISRGTFITNLIKIISQERLPTEHQILERRIRQFLQAGKHDEVSSLLAQFLSDPKVHIGRKRLVEAEQAFAKGNYMLARNAAIQSLKSAGDSILVLNLLGKTFMHLRDHMSALKCFKRAQEMSPNNIERLCHIAESQAELGDQEAAKKTLGSAKNLDEESSTVQETQAKIAIVAGDVASAKEIMEDMVQISSLISYMNNKAVAYAKCGFTKEAVEIYERTISSVPEKDVQTRTVITYNLSLSLIKMNELEKACTALLQLTSVDSKVIKKVSSLAKRLKKTLASGEEFKLRTTEPTPARSAEASGTEASGTEASGTEASGTEASGTEAPGTEASGTEAPGTEAPRTEASGTEASKAQSSALAPELASEQDYRDLMVSVDLKKGDFCCFLLFSPGEVPDPRSATLLAKTPRFKLRQTIEKPSLPGTDQSFKQSA